MSRIMRKSYLEAEVATTERLLQRSSGRGIPGELSRLSFAARISQLKDELAALERQTGRTGEVLLYFYGAPVAEEQGIEAKFAAEVLQAYQELVATQATVSRGPVQRYGPLRDGKAARLHITNVLHGSFGFELEEPFTDVDLFEPTPLARAVTEVSDLLVAVRAGDEVFADAAAQLHSRVYSAFGKFLSVISRANASFRVVDETHEVELAEQHVTKAVERATAKRTAESHVPVPGTFRGVFSSSRRFEHDVDGETIHGALAPDVDAASLGPWLDRPCTAHLRRLTLEQTHKTFTRYTLLRLEDGTESTAPSSLEEEDIEESA